MTSPPSPSATSERRAPEPGFPVPARPPVQETLAQSGT